MKAKWLICNLGKDEHIQQLCYSALEIEREAEVISLKEASELVETTSDEIACVITCGSIWYNIALRRSRPNWVGNYHNKQTFLCSQYYKYWGKYITQQNFQMMTFGELIERKDSVFYNLAKDGNIFIRPDSGEKEFAGEVVRVKDFEFWYKRVTPTQRHLNEEDSADPLIEPIVVSSPVKIEKELRLIIADKKVATGSVYKIANHIWQSPLEEQDDAQDIVAFAEKVLNDNPPPLPPFHVLDIAVHDDHYSILEVGCFCCCGMYDCDRRKAVKAVSEAAELAYEKL